MDGVQTHDHAAARGNPQRYLSVCSGIEAASVAWDPLGWHAVAFSEIEKFPSAVLKARWPMVPNWGDMTQWSIWPDATFNVLVGGTPCQSFSVAGLRKGLDDPRGNLALVYLAIADRYRPDWLVWENVPGVLSSNEGRDFGAFLGALGRLGDGFAYRVLDAQHFGLAQRRRRVFVVASDRGWASAAAVLFERASLQGHPPPREEARKVDACCAGNGSPDCLRDKGAELTAAAQTIFGSEISNALLSSTDTAVGTTQDANIVIEQLAATLRAGEPKWDKGNHSQLVPSIGFSASDNGRDATAEIAPTLRAMGSVGARANAGGQVAVAFSEGQSSGVHWGTQCGQVAPALTTGGGKPGEGYPAVCTMSVRRLTPVECERLQGFPDEYTCIAWRGRPADLCPDGPRYKALGNSMPVPVMRWIGERIVCTERIRANL